MPLMTLCTTAIDIVPRTREKTVNDIVKFLSTDTVTFFANPNLEPGLREQQDELFDPILAWFEKKFGVKLTTNRANLEAFQEIMFTQPDSVRQKVHAALMQHNDWELAALDKAAGESKSTCIAAMLCSGALSCETALEACKAEERYQTHRWGDVPSWHGIDYGLTRLNLSSVNFFATTLREDQSLKSKLLASNAI